MQLIHKPIGHPNITIASLFKFGLFYGITLPMSWGLLWVLTEYGGLHYMLSAVIAGMATMMIRFLSSAIFAFNPKSMNR